MRLFEWNEEKAGTNLTKHGVSFQEAATVFDDPLAGIAPETRHFVGETREIAAGRSSAGRLLLVSFTDRGHSIRIISAREMTKSERRLYEEKDRH